MQNQVGLVFNDPLDHLAPLELHSLRPPLDLNEKSALVRGKGEKERLVPFGRKAEQAILDYLPVREKRAKCPYPLINPSGYRLSDRSVQRILKKYGAQAGVSNLHPQSIRYACATHIVQAGADIRTLQEFLGHSSLSTTTIYVPGWADTELILRLSRHQRRARWQRITGSTRFRKRPAAAD